MWNPTFRINNYSQTSWKYASLEWMKVNSRKLWVCLNVSTTWWLDSLHRWLQGHRTNRAVLFFGKWLSILRQHLEESFWCSLFLKSALRFLKFKEKYDLPSPVSLDLDEAKFISGVQVHNFLSAITNKTKTNPENQNVFSTHCVTSLSWHETICSPYLSLLEWIFTHFAANYE